MCVVAAIKYAFFLFVLALQFKYNLRCHIYIWLEINENIFHLENLISLAVHDAI